MHELIDYRSVLRALYSQRLRVIVVVVTILCAALLTALVTPYRNTEQLQFYSEEPRTTYMRVEVTEINKQTATARVLEGPQKNMDVEVQFYGDKPRLGSEVLISSDTTVDEPNAVVEPWRFPALVWLLAIMIVLVVLVGGRQGLMSLFGLVVSLAVVVWYIIPQVLAGADALAVSVIGAFVIATLAVTVAHRFAWRTVISLGSIYVVLAVVVMTTWVSGLVANLTGVYDETSSYLGVASGSLDLYGILLGGIIIASLGVLDDVVTTQVAAVDELYKLKPRARWRELFMRGMSVGREHLSAVINTLALAYVGVALPTILVLSQTVNVAPEQLLLTLNYEYISVEIIRLVISTMGIIVAIPLATALAAWLIGRKQQVIGILRGLQNKLRR